MGWLDRCNIQDLMGKTLRAIHNNNDDELIFECDNGESYRMYHEQDCCESVSLEDVCGDLNDLIGCPIRVAEEVSNLDDLKPLSEWTESYTWTYYNIATDKGFVTLRWYGESNGYYSESVDFEKINNNN